MGGFCCSVHAVSVLLRARVGPFHLQVLFSPIFLQVCICFLRIVLVYLIFVGPGVLSCFIDKDEEVGDQRLVVRLF